MPRYYRRYYGRRSYKKVRYSNETTSLMIAEQLAAGDVSTHPAYAQPPSHGFKLVPSTNVQGVRKVKNMTLSLNVIGIDVPLLCAVVFVPGGTDAYTLNHAAGNSPNAVSLYEPNQNVIMQFVVNPIDAAIPGNSIVQRFRTRLARNLDSNDEIRFIYTPAFGSQNAGNIQISGTFNYAIAY